MKVKILFILFFTLTITCFSQQDSTKYLFNSGSNKEIIYLNATGFLFTGIKENEIILTNDSFKEISRIKIPKEKGFKKENFLGFSRKDNILNLFFLHPRTRVISQCRIDLSVKENFFKEIYSLSKEDHVLQAFSENGNFYLLTLPKYQEKIEVWNFDNSTAEKTVYNATMPGFYASIIKNKMGEKEEKKFPEYFLTYIESYNPNNIRETSSHKKIYMRNDSILITIDEAAATHLTVLDLGEKKLHTKN